MAAITRDAARTDSLNQVSAMDAPQEVLYKTPSLH
jgi:hypothetical protein